MDMEQVRTFLQKTLENEKIAGMAVAVTNESGILFAQGFGMESADRPAVSVTPTSLFRAASITKMIAGVTILSLVEEGKLSLEEPVIRTVPWLNLQNKHTQENMTLEHLLSHTSGLPAEYTPDGPWPEQELEHSLQQGLDNIEIAFRLGEKHLYSNWGIRLASLVAEKVTGTCFTQLAKERVLDPLGMHMSTFDLHVAATYPLCLPHEEADGRFRVCRKIPENAVRQAAGGLFSNTEDLCRFARMLLREGVSDDGVQILKKETVEQMKRKRASAVSYDGYGLTLMQKRYADGLVYGHLGSAPPYATSLVVHPTSGLGVVTLMNTKRNHLRFEIPYRILDILTNR